MSKVFISYANINLTLATKIKDKLHTYGISAWLYDRDKALSESVWNDICKNIDNSDAIVFIVSKYTGTAQGQIRELEYAKSNNKKIIPVFLKEDNINDLPLKNINGLILSDNNFEFTVYSINKFLNPSLTKLNQKWFYPIPGQWLEVCQLDHVISEKFEVGDKFQFRCISPMGFFKCYALKITDYFWILPENVQPVNDPIMEKELDNQVPQTHRINWMSGL